MACVHLVPQSGDFHELSIQFQDVLHLPQPRRINFNFEHDATNLSGRAGGMQSILQRNDCDLVPSELAIAPDAKLRK